MTAGSHPWRERQWMLATMTPRNWRFWLLMLSPVTLLSLFLVNAPLLAIAAGLAAIVLFQPFVGIPFIFFLGMLGDLQHFSSGISIVKFLVAIVAVGSFASSAARQSLSRKTGVTLPLILFIAIYCAGNVLNPSETYSWQVIFTWMGYPLAFMLVLSLVTTKRRIQWVLAALIAGAVLAGLSSGIEVFLGVNLLTSFRGIQEVIASNGPLEMQRVSGLFNDANAAAYMHILSIPMLISLILLVRSWIWRYTLFALSLVSSFGLLASFSRSGYLGVAAALGCLLLFLQFHRASRVLALSTLALVLLASFIPFNLMLARFYVIPYEIGSVADRSIYYSTATKLIFNNPIVPAGEHTYMSQIVNKVGFPLGPHSNILSVGVNGGLIALAAFLWLIYRYLRFVHAGLRSMRSQSLRHYALGAYAGIVGFQVQGLFITNFGWFVFWAAAAIPLCCIIADQNYPTRNESDPVFSTGDRLRFDYSTA
jgi:hypothetical protein